MTLLQGDARATRVGEVVEASTAEFSAECYELECAPPFGSFVRAGDSRYEIFGVVTQVWTGSIDPGRRVSARGADVASEDALFANNPELSTLLRTAFRVAVVGFRVDGVPVHRLPPQPPRLHGFVHQCDDDDTRAFAERLDYLVVLVNAALRVPSDEVIGATLRHAARAMADDRDYLVRAGKRLAPLLDNDPRRLGVVLRSAQG